jgi:hypothetical protein
VKHERYRPLHFENTSWTCWIEADDRGSWDRFDETELSNNHLLSVDPRISETILGTKPGDQIRLRGVLAEYSNLDNSFKRGSSTSRTDRGNGACETIYVDDFQIVKEANGPWRRLYTLSRYATYLSLIVFVVMFVALPYRRT